MVRNKAKCKKCGTEIESRYRHDFRTCMCGAISVDGGQDYIRRVGNPEDFDSEYDAHLRAETVDEARRMIEGFKEVTCCKTELTTTDCQLGKLKEEEVANQ